MSFKKITENESLYKDLELKTTSELLTFINKEDEKVALAVNKIIPEIFQVLFPTGPKHLYAYKNTFLQHLFYLQYFYNHVL